MNTSSFVTRTLILTFTALLLSACGAEPHGGPRAPRIHCEGQGTWHEVTEDGSSVASGMLTFSGCSYAFQNTAGCTENGGYYGIDEKRPEGTITIMPDQSTGACGQGYDTHFCHYIADFDLGVFAFSCNSADYRIFVKP